MTFCTAKGLQALLGQRVHRLRLSRNMDQRATADKAGVSVRALGNLEAGRGSTVETLLRTLRSLDYLQGIEALAPEIAVDTGTVRQSQPAAARKAKTCAPEDRAVTQSADFKDGGISTFHSPRANFADSDQ